MIDISVCQFTGLACQLAPTISKEVASTAADAFLNVVASGLSFAADWLVGHVVALVNVQSPDVSQG